MKSDPTRENLAAYAFTQEFLTRFSDTDAVGHINNVAVCRYHDNAVMAFELACEGRILPPGQRGHWMLTHQDVSMQAETFYPAPLQWCVGVSSVSETHFTLAQALFQEGRCTGLANTAVALLDEHGQAMGLCADLRERLAAWRFPAQVAAKD